MRCLVLAAVLATPLALSVRAQPVPAAPFSAPLGIGNRWEYVLTNAAVTPPAVTGYLVATVDGEVTVNGEPYRVLTRQQFAADRTPATARTTCAYNPARGTAPAGSTSLPDYSCVGQVGLPPPLPWSSGPTTVTPAATVEVGSQSVPVDSLVTFGSQGSGTGGAYSATVYAYATGIGQVSTREYGRFHQAAGGGVYDRLQTLVYARIGSRSVGASAVAGETSPPDAPGLALGATPNPFADEVRIEATGATGRVTLDVFDTLGRRVDGGTVEGDSAFEFRPTAAGIYLVRATSATGQVATRRVVRR